MVEGAEKAGREEPVVAQWGEEKPNRASRCRRRPLRPPHAKGQEKSLPPTAPKPMAIKGKGKGRAGGSHRVHKTKRLVRLYCKPASAPAKAF